MNLYRKTGDLRLVQTALGHKHISTTEIYARVEDRKLRRALDSLWDQGAEGTTGRSAPTRLREHG
jgi:site-specific recombinase XerD